MALTRALAEGRATEGTPIELQLGFLIERHGLGVMGPDPDLKQIMRATRLVDVYRVFAKLGQEGGIKQMTTGEWGTVKDVMERITNA